MIEKYKELMDSHLSSCYDYKGIYGKTPLFRYDTFKKAFSIIKEIENGVIVELGTARSYVHGGLVGCNSDNMSYWTPNAPENWDWGAGVFLLMASEEFKNNRISIHTVDIEERHISRAKVMTDKYKDRITYHVDDSVNFLKNFDKKIDLLYVDTGDMTPIETTAMHQLNEAKVIIERKLISDGGCILIDDVRNPTPIINAGEKSLLGKAKYSIPYLLENNFKIIMDEYQILLRN